MHCIHSTWQLTASLPLALAADVDRPTTHTSLGDRSFADAGPRL